MTIPCALPRRLQAYRYHPAPSASSRPVRGRLAPRPTGYMRLGNAWAFLLAWLAVRSAGGPLVRRLEDSGLITSYGGDETVGARRKYYKITAQGREAYRQAREEWQNTGRILNALLEEEA